MIFFDKRAYQIKHSRPDSRDWIYKNKNIPLRQEVYLTAWDSLIEDQGNLGSCAAEAITSAYELRVKYQYPERFTELSRLFLYYNTRKIENTISEDAGVFQLRNAFQSIRYWGICSESVWPYDIQKFDTEPSPESYEEARKRKITSYKYVPGFINILENINEDRPVVIGLEIFSGFLTLDYQNPIVMPPSVDEVSLGGHAMCVLGYSLAKQQFYVKNSFGTDWGDSGYCWIPFEYFKQYVFESWIFEITDQITEFV